MDGSEDRKEAMKKATKEYLMFNLDFDEDELGDMEIVDVKRAKDEVLYIALRNQEHIKEIHYRRAASENQDLLIRDYIPPPFYNRYMEVVKKASDRRAVDGNMKEIYQKNGHRMCSISKFLWMSRKQSNRIRKSVNGNGKNIHWNLGS